MKNKFIALLTILGVSMSAILSGCGNQSPGSASADSTDKSTASASASTTDKNSESNADKKQAENTADKKQTETTAGEPQPAYGGDYSRLPVVPEDTPLDECVILCDYKKLELFEKDNYTLEDSAWNQLLSNSKITKINQKYLDEGSECFKTRMTVNARKKNMTLEEYLKSQSYSDKIFKEMTLNYALDMAVQAQILYLVAEKEGISDSDKEVEKLLDDTVKNNNYESRDAMIADYGEPYLRQSALMQRLLAVVVDYCKDNTKTN